MCHTHIHKKGRKDGEEKRRGGEKGIKERPRL